MAEVQAKEGAQETAITLLGLLAGLACASVLNSDPMLQWVAFAVLTAIHVAANYAAVRVLELRTLNRSRMHALVRAHLTGTTPKSEAGALQPLPTPAFVSKTDPILPLPFISTLFRTYGWPALSASGCETCPLRVGSSFPAAAISGAFADGMHVVNVAIRASAAGTVWTLEELRVPPAQPAHSKASSMALTDWTAAWGAVAGEATDAGLLVLQLGRGASGGKLHAIDLVLFSGASHTTQLCCYFAAVAAMHWQQLQELQSGAGRALALDTGVIASVSARIGQFPAFLRAAQESGWNITLAQLGDAGIRAQVTTTSRGGFESDVSEDETSGVARGTGNNIGSYKDKTP